MKESRLYEAADRSNSDAWRGRTASRRAQVAAALLLAWAIPAGRPQALGAAQAPEGADTVLARVAGRTVTASDFRAAWRASSPTERPERLTPDAARRFLDLLVDREVLVAAALERAGDPTPGELTELARIEDRLALGRALAHELAETRAGLATRDSVSAGDLGILTRERVVAGLAPRLDSARVEAVAAAFRRLPVASADSSVAAQIAAHAALPDPGSIDTAAVIGRSSFGALRVAELIAFAGRLDPIYRPSLGDPEAVRGMVENLLFERWLRKRAADRRVAQDPQVRAALAAERERMAVTRFVAREVYERIADDTEALRRFHREHPEHWSLPARFQVVRLVLEDQASAVRMARLLSSRAEAESLVARGARGGIAYTTEWSAEADSGSFQRARRAGTGVVLGPESTPEGWEVCRVLAFLPPRRLGFAEAEPRVAERWRAAEAERMLGALIARERGRRRVEVERRALAEAFGARGEASRLH